MERPVCAGRLIGAQVLNHHHFREPVLRRQQPQASSQELVNSM